MRNFKWLFVIVACFLSACGDEVQPSLVLKGHWVVQHGFDNDCQVSVSFYDEEWLLMTFYSFAGDACQPERYGVQNNLLMINFSEKRDYFNEAGALAADMQFSVSDLQLKGTLRFTETVTGLSGMIMSAQNDPENLLRSLLATNYTLTRVSEEWFLHLRGAWGTGCDPVDDEGGCEVLVFSSEMDGQYRQYEQCHAPLMCEVLHDSADLVYALRNAEKLTDDSYVVDLVILGPGSGDRPPGEVVTLVVSQDQLQMRDETFKRLDGLPVVTELSDVGRNLRSEAR